MRIVYTRFGKPFETAFGSAEHAFRPILSCKRTILVAKRSHESSICCCYCHHVLCFCCACMEQDDERQAAAPPPPPRHARTLTSYAVHHTRKQRQRERERLAEQRRRERGTPVGDRVADGFAELPRALWFVTYQVFALAIFQATQWATDTLGESEAAGALWGATGVAVVLYVSVSLALGVRTASLYSPNTYRAEVAQRWEVYLSEHVAQLYRLSQALEQMQQQQQQQEPLPPPPAAAGDTDVRRASGWDEHIARHVQRMAALEMQLERERQNVQKPYEVDLDALHWGSVLDWLWWYLTVSLFASATYQAIVAVVGYGMDILTEGMWIATGILVLVAALVWRATQLTDQCACCRSSRANDDDDDWRPVRRRRRRKPPMPPSEDDFGRAPSVF